MEMASSIPAPGQQPAPHQPHGTAAAAAQPGPSASPGPTSAASPSPNIASSSGTQNLPTFGRPLLEGCKHITLTLFACACLLVNISTSVVAGSLQQRLQSNPPQTYRRSRIEVNGTQQWKCLCRASYVAGAEETMETGNKGCHSLKTRRCHTVSPCSLQINYRGCTQLSMCLCCCLKHPEPHMTPDLPCSATATYDDLLLSNEYFDEPIPLAEMVEFLVDAWIQVRLPGKDLFCTSSLSSGCNLRTVLQDGLYD